MINQNIDKLISEALKAKEYPRLEVLRLIKAEFLKYATGPEALALKELWKQSSDEAMRYRSFTVADIPDAAVIRILKKMVSQRQESAKMYEINQRYDLANNENNEIKLIKEYLPADISEADIEAKVKYIVTSEEIELVKQNMGKIIKLTMDALPLAGGSTVSKVVKTLIENASK